MKSLILLVALLGLAYAFTAQEYQQAFSDWTQKHGKAYTTEEFQSRFSVFKSNMDYVRDWNANNDQTILGLTVFADLTNEEFKKIYLGTVFDGSERLSAAASLPEVALPQANDTVNWATMGAVTGIKNQGQCGSCWSFSTTGSVEGAHFQSTGNLVSLSEQNLMDCSRSFGNDGCNGGLMDDAFRYIISNRGIDTEASYPYMARNEPTCKFTTANIGATISSYKDVTSGSEAALLTAATARPVSVAIDASHNSFQLYMSGIYYEPLCSSVNLDHGVLVVGYGADTQGAYWVVKNSWGTAWGMEGYIHMARNMGNNCGIATMASYPIV